MYYMKVIIFILLLTPVTAFTAPNQSSLKSTDTEEVGESKKNQPQSTDKEKELILVKMLVKPRKCRSWPECE